jgi:adenylate kinase
MDDGFLVPDEVVIGMVEDRLSQGDLVNGVIFDGFPRTVAQAEELDKLLTSKGETILAMLALQVPEDELKTRLLLRGKESGRADDQNEEKINNRIRVYQEETLPVSEFYQAQGKFYPVNGVGSIDDIFDDLTKKVDSLKKA